MRAAMAADAVADAGDSFLAVFSNGPGLQMLMASIAGVLLVITTQMACRPDGIVIAVEQEIAAVVECRRLPVRRLVTGRADKRLATMQIITRSRMAVNARVGLEQSVVELHRAGSGQSRPRVIAMASHAVGFGERLKEGEATIRLRDDYPSGGAQADIRDDMAGGATLR